MRQSITLSLEEAAGERQTVETEAQEARAGRPAMARYLFQQDRTQPQSAEVEQAVARGTSPA